MLVQIKSLILIVVQKILSYRIFSALFADFYTANCVCQKRKLKGLDNVKFPIKVPKFVDKSIDICGQCLYN